MMLRIISVGTESSISREMPGSVMRIAGFIIQVARVVQLVLSGAQVAGTVSGTMSGNNEFMQDSLS